MASPAAKVRRTGKQKQQALGRIESLVVENFKSYEGRHEIGPFDKFTCIIGPNGSGKSNIMDAISFCLGIRAKHLRGERLKDLVYRREEEDVESNARSARVILVFRAANGELLHFGRTIDAKGTGTYRYGQPDRMKSVNYDDFMAALAEQSIFVKARNFLVFQGDVMELARRQGESLTGMFETISGSDQLKDEYARLSRELELAQSKARLHFQHRREVEGTVALLARQRAEVERHQELRRQRERLAVEKVLFKLMCAECEATKNRETTEAMRAELARSEAALRARRKEVEDMEVERRRVNTEADKATSQQFVLSSNIEQLKPEIGSCAKQAAHWARQLREKGEQVRQEEMRQRGVEATAKQLKEDRANAEAHVAGLRARPMEAAVQMTEAQLAEYEAAVAQTDALNTTAREGLREAEEQLALLGRELASDQQDLRELEDRQARGAAKTEEVGREKASLELEVERQATSLEQKRRQAAAVSEEVKKFEAFRDSLVGEQRTLRLNLDSAQARRDRLEQVEVRQRVADELRGVFPQGVLGRLSELVLPTQKRFDLPLQMSLGGMAEAFVVSSSAVGRDCVRYLKDKRIAPESFLPLDRMQEPNVGALHLLTDGHSERRLATMCVQHNDKFLERHPHWQQDGAAHVDTAVKFLLNGTVIVDSLAEARATSYTDAKKRGLMPRVVTLQGEVIAPNGNMSVQSANSFGRVEFGGADQLREIKEQEEKLLQVDKDLATLSEESQRKKLREQELLEQARDVEERHQSCGHRLRAADAAQASEHKLSAGRAGRMEELRVRVEERAAKSAELEKKKDTQEGELLKVGRKFFARLNGELGVDDVREAVRREQRERLQRRQEVEKYEDFLRTLATEERNVEQRLKSSAKLDALQRDCAQYQRDIEAAKARQAELEERERQLSERCAEGRTRLRELTSSKDRLEQEGKAGRAEAQRLKVQTDDARKKLGKHTEKVRVLLNIQCGILRDCGERQIELPMLSKDEAALEKLLSREEDIDDMPLQDLEAVCRAHVVDFSALPAERREAAKQSRIYDSGGVDAEYDAQMAELTKEIEGVSLNMRAPEECADAEGRLLGLRKAAEAATSDSQRLAREFEALKTERIALFMKCYKHVDAHVHPFYNHLTSYDGFDGGSAYLDLDDAEEPYNGGITFTACPPGKRFFPMELLSGGERSMASMALLFAMHSYQPPPFMILDEVDAPFDRKNTGSLVAYLKKLDFQCLVISLKDTFFSHSDSIVGIYKDKELQSSGALSLPLRRLGGEEDETPETERPAAESQNDAD